MPRRMGRPGLMGTMARTAVIAGTATAVSGSVQRKQAQGAAQQQAAAAPAATPPAPAATAQAEPAPAVAALSMDQKIAKIKELGQLKEAGLLTDEELAGRRTPWRCTGDAAPAGQAGRVAGAVVSVLDLRKAYGAERAVDGVSFEVAEGEVFGIVGPNEAGGTTTVECLEGLRVPDSGHACVLDMIRRSRGRCSANGSGSTAGGRTVRPVASGRSGPRSHTKSFRPGCSASLTSSR